MSSILKCVVPKSDPKACHLTGDYDIIARCFSDNWREDARLIAASPALYDYVARCAAKGDVEAQQLVEAINASR